MEEKKEIEKLDLWFVPFLWCSGWCTTGIAHCLVTEGHTLIVHCIMHAGPSVLYH